MFDITEFYKEGVQVETNHISYMLNAETLSHCDVTIRYQLQVTNLIVHCLVANSFIHI